MYFYRAELLLFRWRILCQLVVFVTPENWLGLNWLLWPLLRLGHVFCTRSSRHTLSISLIVYMIPTKIFVFHFISTDKKVNKLSFTCCPPLPLRLPWFLNPTVLHVTCFAHLDVTWQKPHRKAKVQINTAGAARVCGTQRFQLMYVFTLF